MLKKPRKDAGVMFATLSDSYGCQAWIVNNFLSQSQMNFFDGEADKRNQGWGLLVRNRNYNDITSLRSSSNTITSSTNTP